METDFLNIEYLKEGSSIQRKVYKTITKFNIIEQLRQFNPILVGTFPLGINIETSDIDIIGSTIDFSATFDYLVKNFSEFHDFKIQLNDNEQTKYILCSFWIKRFRIEIFLENKNPIEQNAYKHMLIEADILKQKDELFKQEIIDLKNKGLKTEEAFALLLGLDGDPYQKLLDYQFN